MDSVSGNAAALSDGATQEPRVASTQQHVEVLARQVLQQ
jgi:hypothetical protein